MTAPCPVRFGDARPRGRHVRLVDYLEPDQLEIVGLPFEEELAAIPDGAKRSGHVTAIDCPGCDRRTLAYDGRCRMCGGQSWLPAGHVDRVAMKRLREAAAEGGGGG